MTNWLYCKHFLRQVGRSGREDKPFRVNRNPKTESTTFSSGRLSFLIFNTKIIEVAFGIPRNAVFFDLYSHFHTGRPPYEVIPFQCIQ